jgi:ABC-type lipoprotein release transport system permease subunit
MRDVVWRSFIFVVLAFFLGQTALFAEERSHRELVNEFSSMGDRRPGSAGNLRAAQFIVDHLKSLNLDPQVQTFSLPVRKVKKAELHYNGSTFEIQPFFYNAITPQAIDGGIEAPLIYVGGGSMAELKGKQVKDSIILMDFNSGIAWQHIASLGARAAILVDRAQVRSRHFFEEKKELSPIQFPIFWMEETEATTIFGPEALDKVIVATSVKLESSIFWEETSSENIYCLIPGNEQALKNELVVIEAFYDNTAFLPGNAPGADEATSIVTLLKTAETLSKSPPGRPVLLLATSGHSNALAGLRELIWAMQSKSKDIRNYSKLLKQDIKAAKANVEVLNSITFPLIADQQRDLQLQEATKNTLKALVDEVSRELVYLRLHKEKSKDQKAIESLVAKRFALRQLGWKRDFGDLSDQESELLQGLIPESIAEHEEIVRVRTAQLRSFESTRNFRELTRDYSIGAFISLHLSSHGNGIGGFHEGWFYQLRPRINRTGIYSAIGDVLRESAMKNGGATSYAYVDSLSPSRMRTWDTWFIGKPFHGGEISSMAGYLGITLATVGDGRSLWGTPWDVPSEIDWQRLVAQEKLVSLMIGDLSRAEKLSTGKLPRNGFSTVTGRANLLLQGELFADYPAYKTTIMAFQGEARLYTTVDPGGNFIIKGVADKKNVGDKVIIEGYRFDEKSGRVKWAIDKKETGKNSYRVKMQRENMKTDLIMFSCTGTTIFGTLEPRNFNYLTKLSLLDGRRDAPPQHYWYSRIDTRSSIIATIYTEPGTWLKLTLSDTVLTRKLILSNSTEKSPSGFGYPVDTYSSIPNTTYHAAKDIWTLLKPRIDNLEKHGIVDPQVNTMQRQGLAALAKSEAAYENMDYLNFRESAQEALALAGKVYVQVEKTQKDVLFGVLFYIALFVPFAFCMERFLFNYASIYKRITAFTALLVGLIVIIYNVHPAFQLAYSPMVVILAFFIIGLSLMVTLIIFFRFEEEMILMQRHASHQRPSEISRWKAFVAAFFLGVSNLRRRRLRTTLTCLTLVILTFTIMSFTTVKSSQKANTLFFQEYAPYVGLLIKSINWESLPRQAKEPLAASVEDNSITASRVWLEGRSMTRPIQVPLYNNQKEVGLLGLVGMDPTETKISDIDTILTSGRWFNKDDRQAIIIDSEAAAQLGLSKINNTRQTIRMWGSEYHVVGIFSAPLLELIRDLDGEPLTPVTFPQEASAELSDVEQEAMESGDEVRSLQSRYVHTEANQVAFIPANTLLAMGGALKSIAVKPNTDNDIQALGARLVQRFNLPVFAGDQDGVWFFSPTSTLSYSGVPNILIPLIISIFIVLNTMISSVYERKNEIGVYTSVGLAPSHVSFLFIAEAMALAVISVVLGYLLAQVSAALFSSTSYWEGITVNYSSLAGVAAMILVIAVVLISVIYPSRVAAQIAIPDVKQSFKLPQPVNNRIELILPFFMKYEEHESIGGFIYSYLSGHQDISHGMFSTGPVDIIFSCNTVDDIKQMVEQAKIPSAVNCMHIRTQVWLAPFDFGIMQKVDIQFCPARENSNYLEIKITLQRNSGEVQMWKRLNTMFLHDIRKQLLIWRSIDSAGHTYYEDVLKSAIDSQEKIIPVFAE